VKLSLIAALAENGVIGRDNKLPWHLPNDLKYFRAVTIGKPVIMGRRTWESLGRPLPGRTNIVITRQPAYEAPGARVVATLDEAIRLAESVALIDGQDECVVIGGAEIYALALPRCDRLYLTEVHATVDGDAHFPAFDRARWREQTRERFAAEGPNPFDYSFVVYERLP
jgi:dihydrofolate reductase